MTITKEQIQQFVQMISAEKKKWPEGPWTRESDYHSVRTEDFEGLIIRNKMGALCGYIGVQEWHPWYGKDYNSIDASAHGGLTYSDFCNGIICHAGEDKVWWVGFDCAHYMDTVPAMLAFGGAFPGNQYRDLDFVRNEVVYLSEQAAGALTWKHKILRLRYKLVKSFNSILRKLRTKPSQAV